MGGTNATIVKGLRFHVSGREVHIHDDNRSIKVILDAASFKKDANQALLNIQREGAVKLDGTNGNSLYLVNDGKTVEAFVSDGKGCVEDEIRTFLKGL